MQKVVDIKFLKVYWSHNANLPDLKEVMDKAYVELEGKIKEYLTNGWVMKGEVVEYNHGSGFGTNSYILQTMVKYDTTKEAELLTF